MLEFATLFFVRSGVINMSLGYLKVVGTDGAYWSGSGIGVSTAYDLDFNIADASPSNGPTNRYYAFSLRCLQE